MLLSTVWFHEKTRSFITDAFDVGKMGHAEGKTSNLVHVGFQAIRKPGSQQWFDQGGRNFGSPDKNRVHEVRLNTSMSPVHSHFSL